ncbi:MAG: V-type ATP synthase subunit I, partial [Bacteroidales bacterium]|nr:V-type ATP synthase subunit I [Bacteroidales bacterium]
MKKYSFLVYHLDYDDFLKNLRDLGVVHLIEKHGHVSEDIKREYKLINHVDQIIRFLEKRGSGIKETNTSREGRDVFNSVCEMQEQLEKNSQSLTNIRKEIDELLPWGNVSSDMLRKLDENGIRIKYYVTPERKYNPGWEDEYPVEIINKRGGNVYFVVVERNQENIILPAEEFKFPERSLSELNRSENDILAKNRKLEDALDELASTVVPQLKHYKDELIQHAEYDKAKHFTDREAEERLMVFEGWVPENKTENLNRYLNESSVVYITSEANPEEKVPILLKNKGFFRNFEQLGELYSLPKYGELDLTPFFAPFYALFFGFCLGDAGYGLLLTSVAIIARYKVNKEIRPVTKLILYLGLATILFGLIGGTFFGINLYNTNLPVYSSLQEYFDAEGTNINNLLFNLSLILGGIQITFGLIIRAVNETIQFGWKTALGTIGWIILILGLATIYILNKLGGMGADALKPALYGVLIVSGLLILFLNNLKRNVFKNLGLGLWNSYNMVTGIIGDALSYIRLFAL